jgi:hypothetical protein
MGVDIIGRVLVPVHKLWDGNFQVNIEGKDQIIHQDAFRIKVRE